MKLRIAFLIASLASPLLAAPLDHSEFTEVVNDVRVIQPGARSHRRPRVHEEFHAPEILRTGADSRVELVAADQTVTRIGANTLFSFEANSRDMELQKGSILFHSPTGRGGGTIHTHTASAAVLGTTLIVSATREGAMKVMLLEGKGKVSVPGGRSLTLRSGQMAIVLPGGRLSPVLEFQLSMQASGSRLVGGFHHPLASAPRIAEQARVQDRKLRSGELRPAGSQKQPPPPKDRNSQGSPDRSSEGAPPPPPPPPPPGPEAGGQPYGAGTQQAAVPAVEVKRGGQLPPRRPPPPPQPRPSRR